MFFIIMEQLINKASNRTISFWYGARNRRELFYRDIFDQLALDQGNFRWTVALSAQEPDEQWPGGTGCSAFSYSL